MESTHKVIRRQLESPCAAPTVEIDGMAIITSHLPLPAAIKVQLDAGLDKVTLNHASGTVTLTPEQARAVLEGGELVVELGKVVVR